jgi:hypothetical protein
MHLRKIAAHLAMSAILILFLASCQDAPASTVFDTTRTVNVFLPAGYATHDEPLPVLYLVDGGVRQDFIPLAGRAPLATLAGQYRAIYHPAALQALRLIYAVG